MEGIWKHELHVMGEGSDVHGSGSNRKIRYYKGDGVHCQQSEIYFKLLILLWAIILYVYQDQVFTYTVWQDPISLTKIKNLSITQTKTEIKFKVK